MPFLVGKTFLSPAYMESAPEEELASTDIHQPYPSIDIYFLDVWRAIGLPAR